jgi:hypothetical protein
MDEASQNLAARPNFSGRASGMKLAAILMLGLAATHICGSELTFSKDVAPILYNKCVSCHHPGDIAPMSLLTYSSTRPWARAIRQAVLTKRMPPWHADPHYGVFENDPTLSQQEIDTICLWADQGAKEGDPKDLPAQPAFVEGWRIGKPDVVFSMPAEYTVKANASDDYQNFTVPTGLQEDLWITAVELRPGNRRVVHHAHVYVTPPKSSQFETVSAPSLFDRLTFKGGSVRHVRPGAPVVDDACRDLGEGGLPDQKFHEEAEELTTFVPGRAPEVYPPGYARLIPAGSTLTFQIHYARGTGKDEKDRSSVAFIIAKEPPRKVLRRLDMDAYLFQIPAGAPNHEVTFCYDFKENSRLLAFTPHMHFRGKDMKWELMRPDATKQTLLFIPRYDFNWQIEYKLKNPVPAPKGSRLIVTAHFDNSVNNPFNPDASKTIRWGEPTSEEMAATWVLYDLPEEGAPAFRAPASTTALIRKAPIP